MKSNEGARRAEASTRWLEIDRAAEMVETIEHDPRFAALVELAVVDRFRRWAAGRSDVEAALIGGEVIALASLALARKSAGEWIAPRPGVTKDEVEGVARRLAGRIEAAAREPLPNPSLTGENRPSGSEVWD
jgi:hypothetical protein